MKKTLTLLWMAAAFLAAASCSKSEMDIQEADIPEAVIPPSVESVDSVKVNISVSSLTPDTKAVKKGWEKGDILNVYLNDNKNIITPDFTLTYDGSSWKASALDASVAARLKTSGGTLYGFWEDSNSCISNDVWEKTSTGAGHIFFPGVSEDRTTGVEVHLVASFQEISYTYSNGVLTASINNWKFQQKLQIVVSGLTYSPGRYTMYSEGLMVQNTIHISDYHGFPYITISNRGTGESGHRIAGIENQDGVAFYASSPYSNYWKNINLYLIDNQEGKAYVFEKGGEVLIASSALYSVKIPFSKFREAQVMDAVDLGLSVKWGTCNLGATEAHNPGDYLAWGETAPYYTPGHATDYTCTSWKDGKTGYNWWPSYQFALEPTIHIPNPLWKYTVRGDGTDHSGNWWSWTGSEWIFTGDNRGTLLKEDDAAHALLGGLWHIPTAEQWQELIDNCTWKWNEDYGENVWVVTSKKNGASIILPAVGWRTDDKLNERYNFSAYWSSSIFEYDPTNARCLFFGGANAPKTYQLLRSYGLSIRPVKETT